jgi:uncharacterized protein
MSERVASRTANQIRSHCESHGKTDAVIIFHGGEPLLGGVRHLDMLTAVLLDVFSGSGIELKVGIQSNGLLFTPAIGDLLVARGVSLGISIDGPPHVNDIARVDRSHRPTSARLEAKLDLLTSPDFRRVFSGFLCVINPDADPIEVAEYLLDYSPPGIDFLFPLNNFDARPPGKETDARATPYGDWLIAVFDHYWARPPATTAASTSIRVFDSLIRLIGGASSLVESLGLDPVDLIVVEANGEIEAVDALKSTYDGATALGYNVFDHDFDVVAADLFVRQRQSGADSLCQECQECPIVSVCGGGYLAHRYSSDRLFDNPSVYSSDLEKLIRHIHSAVAPELAGVRDASPISRLRL